MGMVDGMSSNGASDRFFCDASVDVTSSKMEAIPEASLAFEGSSVVLDVGRMSDRIGPSVPSWESGLGAFSGPQSVSECVKFVVDRATESAMEAVLSCAMDNAPYWRVFFEQGLADAIAEEPKYEAFFLERLCGGIGLPYAADILDGYLSTLPENRLQSFFHDALKKKSHPASRAFVKAVENTTQGCHFVRILGVLFRHGLKMESMGRRIILELESALGEGHVALIETVMPHLMPVSSVFLAGVVSQSKNPLNVVQTLVEHGCVDLVLFTDPKVMAASHPSVRDYVVGRLARLSGRKPEEQVEEEADDEFIAPENTSTA